MTDDMDKTIALDAYFKAERDDMPEPSAALMARIMADIDQVADTREALARAPEPLRPDPLRKGLLARIFEGLGGWPTVSGMATAGIVGVVMGVSPPQSISDLATTYINGTSDYYLVDPYDGFGFDSVEG